MGEYRDTCRVGQEVSLNDFWVPSNPEFYDSLGKVPLNLMVLAGCEGGASPDLILNLEGRQLQCQKNDKRVGTVEVHGEQERRE